MALPIDRPLPSRSRKRRLRKKLHIEEFQVLGFEVDFRLNKSMERGGTDRVFDFFIDRIEQRELSCGGGGSIHELHFFITRRDDTSTTQDDRRYVLEAINAMPEVVQVNASDFIDAHYPDDP